MRVPATLEEGTSEASLDDGEQTILGINMLGCVYGVETEVSLHANTAPRGLSPDATALCAERCGRSMAISIRDTLVSVRYEDRRRAKEMIKKPQTQSISNGHARSAIVETRPVRRTRSPA